MAQAKKKRSRAVSIVLFGIGAAVLAVLVVVALGVFFFLTTTELPVTEADRRVLVSAEDVASFYNDWQPAADAATVTKLRYFDGSLELEMVYEAAGDDEPYIVVNVSHERDARDARMTYETVWTGSVLGMNLADSDFDVEVQPRGYSYGDASKFALIRNSSGEIGGTMFVTRIGNDVFFLMTAGLYFDDGELFGELVEPKLAALEKHRWR